MRRFACFVIACILFLSFVQPLAAQPVKPFIQINDQHVRINELLNVVKSPPFYAPDYFTPVKLYYVNEPIHFLLDKKRFKELFPTDGEVLWDFGDKDKLAGTEIFHTYKDKGVYTVKIHRLDSLAEIATIQINVVTLRNYTLPKAVIAVDNTQLMSHYYDEVDLGKSNKVTLDGSASTGDILSYIWYFDDGNLSNQKKITYEYKSSKYRSSYFPILKVIDKNGYESTATFRLTVQKEKPTFFHEIKRYIKKFLLLFS